MAENQGEPQEIQKDCMLCKLASGTFLSLFGVYQYSQINWQKISAKDRAMSAFLLCTVSGLVCLNFWAAYEINAGVQRPMAEMRPSYTARYTGLYRDYQELKRLEEAQKKQ